MNLRDAARLLKIVLLAGPLLLAGVAHRARIWTFRDWLHWVGQLGAAAILALLALGAGWLALRFVTPWSRPLGATLVLAIGGGGLALALIRSVDVLFRLVDDDRRDDLLRGPGLWLVGLVGLSACAVGIHAAVPTLGLARLLVLALSTAVLSLALVWPPWARPAPGTGLLDGTGARVLVAGMGGGLLILAAFTDGRWLLR